MLGNFAQRLYELTTGQYFVHRVATTNWITTALAIGSMVGSLWGGYQRKKAADAGGQAAYDAAFANASDLRNFAGFNADAILGAAGRNAQAQLTIGEANASAIERATARNLMLYGMQADEESRRHIYGEKMIAGRIRAMVGATGVQTNTGTPLMFKYSQIDEGIRQRRFMEMKHYQTMWTMTEEGKDKAYVTRLTANENAAVIMSNAEAQAAISIADAERQAAAMERSGEVSQAGAEAQGTAAMISGITGAIGAGMQGYQLGAFDFLSSAGSNIAASWNQPSFGWQSSGWGGGTGIGPQSSFGNTGISQGFTVGGYRI